MVVEAVLKVEVPDAIEVHLDELELEGSGRGGGEEHESDL